LTLPHPAHFSISARRLRRLVSTSATKELTC
jgi:hypothetical protein